VISQPAPQHAGVAHSQPSVSGAAAALQSELPTLHAYEHFVPLQVADDAFVRVHLSPHPLQLFVVFSRVQVAGGPEHEVSWQLHAPLWQSGVGCEHGPQAAPAVPHDEAVWEVYGSQTLPLQHPFGHEVASQTHCPVLLLHSRPAPHAVQVAPAAPHDPFDSLASGSHDEPLQQPAHDPPPHVQAPLAHESPVPHALHAAPAVPH
jgi:hypothetical protein